MRPTPGLLLLAMPVCALAQAPSMGPQFEVNVSGGAEQRVAVAVGAGGTFVVAWQSGVGDDDGYGILARRFDVSGAAVSGETTMNTYTTGWQNTPAIASDSTGAFVMAWNSDNDGSYSGVRARRFDAAAAGVGDDFQVNTYTTDLQIGPRVATNGNAFVVVWTSQPGMKSVVPGQDGDAAGVFGQLYDGAGAPVGGEFQVNVYTTGLQTFPSVAMDSEGGFLVVWESLFGQDPEGSDVYARRYDASGTPVGGEILVNAYTTGHQWFPDVAVDAAGEFVVVWVSYRSDGYGDIAVRRLATDGHPASGELRVNTYTTSTQKNPRIAMRSGGDFVVTWESWFQADVIDIYAQRFDAGLRPLGAEFLVNSFTPDFQTEPAVALDETGEALVAWTDFQNLGSTQSVWARQFGFPNAGELSVDARPSGGASNVNGVLEAGERVTVDPSWDNASATALPLTGAASNVSGPAGPAYSIDDASADYGAIGAGATVDCYDATGDCLEVSVAGSRPSAHWDVTFDEALSSGVTKTWTLHVGESFPDVLITHPFYAYIENLFHNEITSGCGAGNYCPDAAVTRSQMAVFLLKAEHGAAFVPPPCTGVFADVACPSTFADWIEQLAAEGITGGCGNGDYCPDDPVTRAQMAVFLLKAEHGSTYMPPLCGGIYGDVTCPSLFADWIEQLAAEQITGGCGGGNYCPGNPNTRGQMAVFLVKTFGLALYGP